jgi:hypothetical protein
MSNMVQINQNGVRLQNSKSLYQHQYFQISQETTLIIQLEIDLMKLVGK